MRLQPVLVAIAALFLMGCDRWTSTIRIPKAKLQLVADAMVPADLQEKAGLPFPAIVTEAEVILNQGSDQIGLRLSFTAQPPSPPLPKLPFGGPSSAPKPPESGEPITGTISVTGDLSYKEGSFYFKNPSVQDPEGKGLSEQLGGPLAKAVEKLVSQYLEENAIHTLDDATTANKATKAFLKSAEVRDGSLLVTLGM